MKNILAVVLLVVSSAALASNCPELYPNGVPIKVMNTIELCNTQFVTVYDAKKHAAIFSSERFNPNKQRVERVDAFHIDGRAPYVKPSDYIGSGYDRGHMAPAANMGSNKEMFESFLMTNMTPQEPTLNRNSWRRIEDSVRKGVINPVWIITGAMYDANPEMIGPKKNIPVPAAYYKCVYGPSTRCYSALNKKNEEVNPTTTGDINLLNEYSIPK